MSTSIDKTATHIRLSKLSDVDAIENLMKRSMIIFGKGFYSPKQIESCCKHVCVPDQQLIKDETFFVVETDVGKMIGCGGWSFRNTLNAGPKKTLQGNLILDPEKDPARVRAMFVDPACGRHGIGSLILNTTEQALQAHGFTHGYLAATLSGFSFYKAKGWITIKKEQHILIDGTKISVVLMKKDFP